VAIVLARSPLCLDPALLLELVERGYNALPNAQFILRHLADALTNGPAVQRREPNDPKD
jgi:hypothetical protein